MGLKSTLTAMLAVWTLWIPAWSYHVELTMVESIVMKNLEVIVQDVEGTVVDEEGESLIGVNIQVKGTNKGTSTDIDGHFILEDIDENAVLVVSYVGYQTQEVTVAGNSEITITLVSDSQLLDEVVVVGYGTQKKATLTGSVTSIDNEDLKRSPTPNLTNSLAGLLPGLVASNRSGQPGSDNSSFLIRGNSTTGSNTPLVLVDGIEESGWERINANDIESISVLKDAAAAIYGVRAANGVVLITTKRGTAGKPVFNLTYNQGFVQPTRVPEMASSATLAEYGNEYLARTGFEPKWTDEEIQKFRDGSDPIRYPNTNWPQELLKKVSLQESTNLNVRGGAENIRYSMSASYQHKDDIIKDGLHDFKNFSIRSNLDADVTENITLSLDLNLGKDDVQAPSVTNWNNIYRTNPQYPVFWPGEYPTNIPSDYGDHPSIIHTGGAGYFNTDRNRFTGKFSYDINLPFVEGLGIDGYFNYSEFNEHGKRWRTPWTYYSYDFDTGEVIPFDGGYLPNPDLTETTDNVNSHLINLRLKFERQFNEHFLSTFIAVEESRGRDRFISAYRKDFLSASLDEIFAGSAANLSNDGYSSENARQNVFGRVSYNYQEKYLMDFNFRYDGSYRFPKDSRWGFFPGISVAWRMSEENFMKDKINNLDYLKLRASYGEIGNDAIAAFQYLQKYNLRSLGYHFGAPSLSSPQPGIYAGVSPNTNITWEVSTISNVGLDAMFFNNRMGFTLDLFNQRRSNILTTRGLELPAYTGLDLPNENIGIVENKGVELELSFQDLIPVREFNYKLGGNLAYAKSNVVDVSEAQNVPEYQKAEGSILGAGLYYEALGIFRTEEQLNSNPIYPGSTVGDPIYKDVNGDGIITSGDKVRMNKSIIPEITYGFNLSAKYGNFDLFLNFAGQSRAWWYIHQYARVDQNTVAELLENRYTPGSMDSKYPWIPQFESPNTDISGLESTIWLQNASFLRLKTMELAYELPEFMIQNAGFQSIRVFVNGSNLLTFSEIKWYDPEGSNLRGTFYPQSKVYNVGAQIKF